MLKYVMLAKIAKEAKFGNRSAMDAMEAFAMVILLVFGFIILLVGVIMPGMFSVGGFKMISQGFSASVEELIGGGAFGELMSILIGFEAVTMSIINRIAPAPASYRYMRRDDYERYQTEMAAHKKVARIGWAIYVVVMALIGLAVYIGIKATMAGNFTVAGIIFGVLGVVGVISGIIGIICWLADM